MAAARVAATMELTLGAETSPRNPPRADRYVLARLDAGDVRGAAQLLMERHGARVYRFCRTALRDATLAADVHQVVFLEVLRDLPRFRRRASLLTWLLGIAHHRVLDAAKRRARHHARAAELVEPVDVGRSPLEALDHARLVAALTSAVAALDARSRTAVLLRYQQGLSFDEMAVICRDKPAALQARVTRALPRLRALLEPGDERCSWREPHRSAMPPGRQPRVVQRRDLDGAGRAP